MQKKLGFTIIEMIVALSIVATLLSIGYVRMVGIERRAPITATVDTFIADFRGQQTEAMTGVNQSTYGISIAGSSYTAGSSVITLPTNITIHTTFPGSVVVFTKGSGDVEGFTPGNNTVTITQTITGEHKILTINQYGAVTSVQ
jgi:prepilin-type N-terminal cleavage/methylation domain-containing protein